MSELRWINRVKSRWFKLGRSFPNRDGISVTRLGDFSKFFATNFNTKVAQKFGKCSGFFKKASLSK